ncbi:hypothetical protein HDU86_002534 [Geranomyces michiganensis]|nr:hypothetical protein HDU86_002534 [Geranomyces michiganensis]
MECPALVYTDHPMAAPLLQPLREYKCRDIPIEAFRGNMTERSLLKEQLEATFNTLDAGVRAVWQAAFDAMQDGIYYPSPSRMGANGPNAFPYSTAVDRVTDVETLLCGSCANQVLAHMMEWYRKNIPRNELVPKLRNRPDCWYGKDCRTQFHSLAHAEKLNHFCENTKTTKPASGAGAASGSGSSSSALAATSASSSST